MRPKEIQEKLGIDADRIKLFKREGIFFPENPPSGNRSTNYTEKDYENLRLLVVLTKSGLTCSDIRKLQDGEWTLEEAIVSRKQSIDAEIARKRNSLSLLSELLDDRAEFETFETDRYWNVITKKEAAGEEFIDIGDMYGYRPVPFIRNIQCPHCGEEHEVDLEDYLYDQSSDERENGMGPDIVYNFNSEDNYECPKCGKVIQIEGWIREYPVGAYDSEDINFKEWDEGLIMAMTIEEKSLLKKLASGVLDGFVGDDLTTTGGSTVWKAIKNGVPVMFKQGPGGKFFNGKENERFEGVMHTLQEWATDEQKLEFLRKFGWLMKDEAVKAYSAMFKPKK